MSKISFYTRTDDSRACDGDIVPTLPSSWICLVTSSSEYLLPRWTTTNILIDSLFRFWTLRRGRSYKIPSLCLSVCMSQLPSLNHAYNFSDFWNEGRGPLVKKSDRARFARKIQNWVFLGNLGSKMAQKWTLCHISRERNPQIC